MDGSTESIVQAYIDQSQTETVGPQSKRLEPDIGGDFVLHHGPNRGHYTISCGDPLVVEFQIEASEAIGEEDAGIGITIISRNGEPVVSMATDVQQAPWTKGSSRRWKVRCDMGRLPLNAEDYFGTVYLTDGEKVTCIFTSAIALQVISHDVFGCGRILPETRYWGPMYSEPEWEIYPVQEDSTFKENT